MARVVGELIEDDEGEFATVDDVRRFVVRILVQLGKRVAVPGFVGGLWILLGLDVLHTPIGMQMLHRGCVQGNAVD